MSQKHFTMPRMLHQQQPANGEGRRKMRWWLLGLGMLILMTVMVIGSAQASFIFRDSCAVAVAGGATGETLAYQVAVPINGGTATSCTALASVTDSTYTGVNVPAGSPITYSCKIGIGGVGTPSTATTITISAYDNNNNLGGGGTPVWTQSLSSCTGDGSTTFVKYMTSDGTVSGTPKAGSLRLFVRMVNTNTGQTYDCNSDNAGTQTAPTGGACAPQGAAYGMIRANPGISAPNITSTNFGAATTYIGGDTLQSSLTSNATEYSSATRSTSFIQTGGGSYTQVGTAYNLVSGATTKTTLVEGNAATWLSGAIGLKWTETGNVAVTGFTGMSYWTFTSATVSTATVVDANTITWNTGDTLTRNGLASSSCTAARAIINRGDPDALSCTWKDPRGIIIPSSQPFRAYATSAGYRDEASITHVDATWGASGTASWTATPLINAVTTTGSSYHWQQDQYAVGQVGVDIHLLNWGNATNLFDVTNLRTFDNVFESKISNGPNTSSFIIGTDIEFTIAKGLRNAQNQLLSGETVTCQRTLPGGTMENPAVAMGTTDASGNTAVSGFQVFAPTGTWTMTCTNTGNGNTATYSRTMDHVSAYTGDKALAISWNVSANGTNYDVNNTVVARFYDVTNDGVALLIPDGDVRLTVFQWNTASSKYDIKLVDRQLMTVNAVGGASFRYNYTVTPTQWAWPLFAFVTMNISGSPYTHGQAWSKPDFTSYQTAAKANSVEISANNTFESRVHANATWCPLPCTTDTSAYQTIVKANSVEISANNTFESRVHANATWCPLPCTTDTSAYQTIAKASSTEQWANTTGFEGQVHANITWCPLPCITDTSAYQTIVKANSVEISANNTFESRVHANATWCPLPCTTDTSAYQTIAKANSVEISANNTFESRVHANATWCPLSSCDTAGMAIPGGFVANNWFNTTACQLDLGCVGNRYFNNTAESQQHANATWCPLPCTTPVNTSVYATWTYVNASFETQPHANATWCPQINATCAGVFGGNFTGNFSGAYQGNGAAISNVTTASEAALLSPAWTMLPYIIILVIALIMVVLGATMLPPGFALLGSMVAVLLALASLADDNASRLLKTFLFVAALALLLATVAVKRNRSYG